MLKTFSQWAARRLPRGRSHVRQGPQATSLSRDASPPSRDISEIQSLVAALAHDFRGPLASIRGFTETLQQNQSSLTPEQTNEFLSVVLKNVASLERLVSSALDVEKWSAKVMVPNFELVPISELLAGVLGRMQPSAELKKISLLLQNTSPDSRVRADSVMIERVLSNLLENAIRYTEEGGRVDIRIKDVARRIQIDIQDTGIGIPSKDLPLIGEPFFRVNRDRSKRTGGSGLGLSLVKQILAAHGSALSIESKVGVGTLVSFSLPQLE
jgi:signal transduction histidine kinase